MQVDSPDPEASGQTSLRLSKRTRQASRRAICGTCCSGPGRVPTGGGLMFDISFGMSADVAELSTASQEQ